MRQPSLTTFLFFALSPLLTVTLQTQAQNVLTNPPGNQTVLQLPAGTTPASPTSLNVNELNNVGYATGFLAGATSGIAAAFAAGNNTVTAEPTYPGTERFSDQNPFTNATTPYGHLLDLRHAMVTEEFSNWDSSYNGIYPTNLGGISAARMTGCFMSSVRNALASFGAICTQSALIVSAPGWTLGPALAGRSSAQGWLLGVAQQANVLSLTSGIVDGFNSSIVHTAPGDTINYFYARSNNGAIAAGDEGVKALAAGTLERKVTYTGTVTNPSIHGTLITTTAINDEGFQAQGQYVINTTNQASPNHSSGTITSYVPTTLMSSTPTPHLLPYLEEVHISTPVTASTAWGTLTANVDTPLNPDRDNNAPYTDGFASSMTLQVHVLSPSSGPGFNQTGLLCIASQFHDCAVPTAFTPPDSSGNMTITLPLRRPHAAGDLVMQGGITGSGLELKATTSPNPPDATMPTLRYLQDVFGATDQNTLIVSTFGYGRLNGFKPGAMTLPTLALTGIHIDSPNTLKATYTAGDFFYYTLFSNSTFNITTTTGGTPLDGPCTNTQFNLTTSTLTCTTGATDTGSYTGSAGLNNNQYELWAMAEVLDVRNPVPAANNKVDGTFLLEPNNLSFAANDVLEETHNASSSYAGFTATLDLTNPIGDMNGVSFGFQGPGMQAPQGGGSYLSYPALANIENFNDGDMYQGSGGTWYPPNLLNMGGFNGAPYSDGIFVFPGPVRQFIEVEPSQIQLSDPNYKLNILYTASANGSFSLSDSPSQNTSLIYAFNQALTIQGDKGISMHPGVPGLSIYGYNGCVQADSTGLLSTTGAPCNTPANIPLRFVGTITTTASGSDPLVVTGLAPSNHCSAQATNAPASTLPVYVSLSTGSVSVVYPSATSGAAYDIFCNIL